MMDHLTLDNICQGGVPEVFQKAVVDLLKNLRDPNTTAEQKRKITLEFTFTPFADRCGAEVSFICNSKLANVAEVKGNIYVTASTNGQLHAYPRDPRQDVLFTEPGGNA